MAARWTSNLAAVQARHERAVQAGLIAAAQVYVNAMRVRLSRGYTTGRYTHGLSANAVTRSEPERRGDAWGVRVGTNVSYAIYYELGFQRRLIRYYSEKLQRWFSRPGPTEYVRVELWVPTMVREAQAMAAAFRGAYAQAMGAA